MVSDRLALLSGMVVATPSEWPDGFVIPIETKYPAALSEGDAWAYIETGASTSGAVGSDPS